LVWIAERLPSGIGSDHLTGLGLAAMLGAGLSFWAARSHTAALWMVIVCLILNWFGDSLDGTVARVRNRQRPRYGFYVDHVVDCLSALFLFAGMAASGFMDPRIATGLLLAYLFLCIESYLATVSLGTFHVSHFRFGPTELRIVLAMGVLRLVSDPSAVVGRYRLFDFGGAIGILGMAAVLVATLYRHTRHLYRTETLS
jgi:phosphatidylglycerophosphate synthase